jgi:multisubunit Na+/H+ antiporter MnhG subunit
MSNPFTHLEKNLGQAGSLFVLVVLGSVGLSFVLGEIGYEPSVAMLLVWVAMPLVAWFMSKAAHAQGRSPWLCGLASLLPPLAIVLFFSLYNRDTLIRMDAAARKHKT